MKRILTLISIIFFLSQFLFSAPALAADESIADFSSHVEIKKDSTAEITETIKYDFGTSSGKHGIFRIIPVEYGITEGTKTTEIADISVADESGAGIPFTTTRDGAYLEIKIGNPKVHVSGERTYVIRYSSKYFLNYFSEHDELYLNITGNSWEVPILNSAAEVILPESVLSDGAKIACFVGPTGSKTACPKTEMLLDESGKVYGIKYIGGRLNAGEGLTAVAGFPTGIVTKVEPVIKKSWSYNPSPAMLAGGLILLFLLPIATAIAMTVVWFKSGREPKGKGTIVAQYEAPDGLSPIQIGGILKQRVENKVITAELIYLAEKGYLSIKRVSRITIFGGKDDYEITKLKDFNGLSEFDRKFFNELFGEKKIITTHELQNSGDDKMYQALKVLKKEVFSDLTDRGYFTASPPKVIAKYLIIGGTIAVLGFGLIFTIVFSVFSSGIIISGVIIMLLAAVMPAKTQKGAETKELILGLREYMSVAEKDRLKFHNAPKKDPKKFEELLPYAVALGVETEWAQQFKDIYRTEPSWYHDPSGASFNAVVFTTNLGGFSKSMNSVVTSSAASGSSGMGGSSGGGFGGGGGGSW